ncbi:hypothetical protein HZS_5286, partial [Henneguya salminicola]
MSISSIAIIVFQEYSIFSHPIKFQTSNVEEINDKEDKNILIDIKYIKINSWLELFCIFSKMYCLDTILKFYFLVISRYKTTTRLILFLIFCGSILDVLMWIIAIKGTIYLKQFVFDRMFYNNSTHLIRLGLLLDLYNGLLIGNFGINIALLSGYALWK